MTENTAIVITSVNEPGETLRAIALGCDQRGHQLIVVGDESGPEPFQIAGCNFYSIEAQRQLDFEFARSCPTRHYARKNIGYLLAIKNGAGILIDLDDDCSPNERFWQERHRHHTVPSIDNGGWINIYCYFTDEIVWPRGFPLRFISTTPADFETLAVRSVDCPIQQAVTDGDADVDAIYRLVSPREINFRTDRRVALQAGSWSPVNSQNTAWWAEAFPLLYLPAYCKFRMTDIWRSFVAQRIALTNGWSVLFQEPNGCKKRNPHAPMPHFE